MPTARDIPEARARLTAWANDPSPDNASTWFTFFLGEPDTPATRTMNQPGKSLAATLAATLHRHLTAAELFYVSTEMTELAKHAGASLTDYRLHPEDLPAPIGLMA